MTERALSAQSLRVILLIMFMVSGFSGLIYESVWGRYLKLFLGHSAYAQTLVLAIFMGGMALGSWFSSRYSPRWKNLLRWYAVTEGIIGLFGLVFHALFDAVTNLAYTTIMPALGEPITVNLLKWTLSALLILPPSVLLGMTFPLMSAGMIRMFPQVPGSSIALLYFANSLGAAVGVLVSGFFLVGRIGLPGTILAAALINIMVAVVVWFLSHGQGVEEHEVPGTDSAEAGASLRDWPNALLLSVALFTGLASFVYEIGWIRMLSLVLGSSTHAFEIMLSAFIAGLAFGGLWIKRRIERITEPKAYLGWIQVVMGILALSTLVVYGQSFEVMRATMRALAKTEQGYVVFNFASHAIALVVMFPATFCAGMTLPLITFCLLKQGVGEKSIGSVYAANTLGAIVGVFLATHVGMPLLGLKGLITFGAGLDMLVGVVLLWTALGDRRIAMPAGAAAISLVALLVTLGAVHLDTLKMASGVYRIGNLYAPDHAKNVFHKDGKTATIDLVQFNEGVLSIITNGKPDASINLRDEHKPVSDEETMVLAGAIPLAVHPDAKTAAVIGMGSGLTSHVLLTSDTLARVDTIEIEEAVVEAAKGFGSRVERVFTDPRSRVFVEDAKAFFSTRNMKYDIISSEPSNPWVSGVSSLFSEEFYRLVSRHLTRHGILVQWCQAYEINPTLVASVLEALSKTFGNYAIFAANDLDMLIVASKGYSRFHLSAGVFAQPALAAELRRYDIVTLADLEVRRIGDKRLLHPLFTSFGAPANSDYFPFLDLRAVKARFLQEGAGEVLRLRTAAVPVVEMLSRSLNGEGGDAEPISQHGGATPVSQYQKMVAVYRAETIKNYFLGGKRTPSSLTMPASLQKDIELLKVRLLDCHVRRGTNVWFHSLFRVARAINAHLPSGDLKTIWTQFRTAACYRNMTVSQKSWLSLYQAVGSRNPREMAQRAEALLRADQKLGAERLRYLLAAGMTGHLALGQPERSLELWTQYGPRAWGQRPPDLLFRLLVAHSLPQGRA